MPKKSTSTKENIIDNKNIIVQENNNNLLLYIIIAIFLLAIFLFILRQIYLALQKPNSGSTESTNPENTESTNSENTELIDSENIELTDSENIEPTILCQPGYKIDNSVCVKDTSIILDKQDAKISCNVEAGFINDKNSCICNEKKGFIKDKNSCKCIEGKYKDKSECKNRNGIWICEHIDYKGKKKFLPYNENKYEYVHINKKYNTISSIKIQGNIKLELYEFSKFKGDMIKIDKSIPNLSKIKINDKVINFNDKVSSIKMFLKK